jgi:two-component system response regulator HydG
MRFLESRPMGTILIVEGEDSLRDSLVAELKDRGHDADEAKDEDLAIERLASDIYDIVVTPSQMENGAGIKVLKAAKRSNPETKVVFTGKESVKDALKWAMDVGAYDYIERPFPILRVTNIIERVLENIGLKKEINYLRHEQKYIYNFSDIVSESPQMKQVLSMVKKVAPSRSTVLITGETGTGKEIIAGAIHFNSPRKSRGFVCVNCAALHENLLESELFGHEKGAFTGAYKQRIGRFEQAHEGTLFLDEIGDMSLATQAKILRVIEEQAFERLGGTKTIKVNVRLLAASNKNLIPLICEDKFRKDLYYRINVVSIHMAPLRDRRDDIIPLANFFLKRFNYELNKKVEDFSKEVREMFLSYSWPGNVRELENVIEGAVLMAEDRIIDKDDISLRDGSIPKENSYEERIDTFEPKGLALMEAEKDLILKTLKGCNWIQKDASKLLGISRRVMCYKIRKYGITHPNWIRNK